MRVTVIIFPGSNCDRDAIHAWSRIVGAEVTAVWHKDTDLQRPDLVFIPGGFSFGDYLRSGAIATFSPVMSEVLAFYRKGGYLFGVCNGFQILCEMNVLPGALLTNKGLKFLCRDVWLRAETGSCPFTAHLAPGTRLRIPIAHGMGQYFADEATLDRLEGDGRVVFRYCDADGALTSESNPNGSARAIAGISSRDGRVLGMMPHPERHVENALGSTDGETLLRGIAAMLAAV